MLWRCCICMPGNAATDNLARRNISVFEQYQVETIVNNAAGCGAQLKTYGELLADDP